MEPTDLFAPDTGLDEVALEATRLAARRDDGAREMTR